jgi:peptidyl-prolyl cis-trans isomerase D
MTENNKNIKNITNYEDDNYTKKGGLTKKIFFFTIIGLIIFSFSFFGIIDYISGGGSNTVIQVGKYKISRQKYESEAKVIRYEFLANFGQAVVDSLLNTKSFDDLVRRTIINKFLVRSELDKHGINISKNVVINYIKTMDEFQVNGVFLPDLLDNYLSSKKITMDEFISKIQYKIEEDILVRSVQNVGNNEEWNEKLKNKLLEGLIQERVIDIITIKNDKQEVSITEGEIKKFFNENIEDYAIPAKKIVNIVNIDDIKDIKKISVKNDEIKDLYNIKYKSKNNKKYDVYSLIINTEDEYKKAKNMIKNRKSTIEIAKAINGQSKDDILLNNIDKDTFPYEISSKLKNLKKGQKTDIIKTEIGYQLIEVVDIKEEKVKSFNEAKKELKEEIYNKKLCEIKNETLEKLDNKFLGGEDVKSESKKIGLNYKTIEIKESNNELDLPEKLLQDMFETTDNYYSYTWGGKNCNNFAYRIVKIIDKAYKNIDEVKDEIKSKIILQKTLENTEKIAKSISNDLINKKYDINHKQITQNKNILRIDRNIQFDRKSEKVNSQIIDYSFKNNTIDRVSDPILIGNSYKIIIMRKIIHFDVDKSQNITNTNTRIVEDLTKNFGNEIPELLLRDISRGIKVKVFNR